MKEIFNELRRMSFIYGKYYFFGIYLRNIFYWNSNYKTSLPLNFSRHETFIRVQTKPPQKFRGKGHRDQSSTKNPHQSPLRSQEIDFQIAQVIPHQGGCNKDDTNSSMGKKIAIRSTQKNTLVSFNLALDRSKSLFTPKLFSLPPPVETLAPWAETMKILVMPRSPLPAPIPL